MQPKFEVSNSKNKHLVTQSSFQKVWKILLLMTSSKNEQIKWRNFRFEIRYVYHDSPMSTVLLSKIRGSHRFPDTTISIKIYQLHGALKRKHKSVWPGASKVLSLLEACFDLISPSSLSMKIQIIGGKITENLGFKSPLRKV